MILLLWRLRVSAMIISFLRCSTLRGRAGSLIPSGATSIGVNNTAPPGIMQSYNPHRAQNRARVVGLPSLDGEYMLVGRRAAESHSSFIM
jgi:hypothetical protein